AGDVRIQEGDEVCNLVHAVRLVECTQLGKRRRSRGLTSGCGAAAAIRYCARQDFAEPAMQLGRIPATALPRLQCGLEKCTQQRATQAARPRVEDRKSTRLNSSHVKISYADFCLKKKKKKNDTEHGHI